MPRLLAACLPRRQLLLPQSRSLAVAADLSQPVPPAQAALEQSVKSPGLSTLPARESEEPE